MWFHIFIPSKCQGHERDAQDCHCVRMQHAITAQTITSQMSQRSGRHIFLSVWAIYTQRVTQPYKLPAPKTGVGGRGRGGQTGMRSLIQLLSAAICVITYSSDASQTAASVWEPRITHPTSMAYVSSLNTKDNHHTCLMLC